MNLFNQIGEKKISAIIRDFYDAAFLDPIIGHFFFHHDKEDLIRKQVAFSIGLLGGPKTNFGRSIDAAHRQLNINKAHFGRRQVLFAEILKKHEVEEGLAEEWLEGKTGSALSS